MLGIELFDFGIKWFEAGFVVPLVQGFDASVNSPALIPAIIEPFAIPLKYGVRQGMA
jgi:hypothetical protein